MTGLPSTSTHHGHPFAHYEHLARLFDYPQRDYPTWVQAAYDLLAGRYVIAAAGINAFAQILPTDGEPFTPEALDEVQEIFTRSFDVQSITTLGVGYVMFGDDYKRGEVLVNLSRELRDVGIDCGSELPDHLPNVLRLIGRWEDRDLAEEFVREILHPALEMMIAEFGERRMEARNGLYRKHFKTLIVSSAERGIMFREPLSAVLEVLRQDFGLLEWDPPERDNDFLRSIDRELEIEAAAGRPTKSGRML
jgi:nitrate reductase assembly molybdenum cofactor insertion protein NarJ